MLIEVLTRYASYEFRTKPFISLINHNKKHEIK